MDWRGFWKRDWYLVGILPLAFGILSYIIVISRSVPLWGLFWVCPITALMTGLVLLFLPHNRFAVSTVIAWIFNGPLLPALHDTSEMLQLEQLHHFASAFVLLVILAHWREVWNAKGLLFGIASYYAFTIITFNLSMGVTNFLKTFEAFSPPLEAGIVFAIAAVIIFLWYWFRRKKVVK